MECPANTASKVIPQVCLLTLHILLVISIILFHILNCSSLGVLLTIAKLFDDSTLKTLTLQSVGRNVLFGFVLIHLWLFVCTHGQLEVLLDKLRIPNPLSEWSSTAWTLQLAIFHRCLEKDWSRMSQLCLQLHNHLMMPYFNEVVLRTLALTPVVFVISFPFAYFYRMNIAHLNAQDIHIREAMVNLNLY